MVDNHDYYGGLDLKMVGRKLKFTRNENDKWTLPTEIQ